LRGGNQKACLNQLELDYDDLRYAFDWLLAHDAERALHLVGALGQFWDMRGHFSEGRETLERVLRASRSTDALATAKAQRAQGLLALRQGDYGPAEEIVRAALSASEAGDDPEGVVEALVHLAYLAYLHGKHLEARAYLQRALPISRANHDVHGETYALTILGLVAWVEGDAPGARQSFMQALALCRMTGDAVRIGKLLNNLGGLATTHGDYDQARQHYEESLAIKRDFADRWGVTYSLVGLGETAFRQGDYQSARQYFEESLPIAQELGMKLIVAAALLGLANVARAAGNFGLAWQRILDSLRIYIAMDDKSSIGTLLEDCGRLALADNDAVSAVHLFAAAEALRADIGASLTAAESEVLAREIDKARAIIGPAAFERAWSEGREMTLDAVEAMMLSRTLSWAAVSAV
jgi:tetratricopeptide (TPR) repeat protein